jgi:hypothetical protein
MDGQESVMVNVAIEDGRVLFDVQGIDKLWALRSRLEIPLAHIVEIEHDPATVGRWWHGFKIIGTDVPGLFAAGTFYYRGELVFWDVSDPESTVIVSLDHERYKKLIVQVADPDDVVRLVRKALAHRGPG